MQSNKQKVYNSSYLPTQTNQQSPANITLQQGFLLKRKNAASSSNSGLMISSSKNITNHLRDSSIDDTRFIPFVPLKSKAVGNDVSGANTKRQQKYEQIKTQRILMRTEKSIEKSHVGKFYNDDSADYYKYWKKKAGEYQELNFDLHRLNSTVQQQNQILKHQIQKMSKRLLRQNEPETKLTPNTQNYDKLDSYYRTKVQQLSKKVQQQEILIKKQDKKIRQLSNYISENYQLKNLLDNMQEKISQMKSGSRENSIDQFSPRTHKKNKFSQFLTIERIDYPQLDTSSNYSFRDKKKSVINLSSANGKAWSSKQL